MRVVAHSLPVLVTAVLAGCSTQHAAPASTTVTVTSAPSATTGSGAAPAPTTVTITSPAGQSPSPSAELGGCADSDLSTTNGPLQSADTQRRIALSFRNTSSHPCTLVGYPGADLVTPVGGVLIHVPRRPANAAHLLTLQPGDTANADVSASAIDTDTGNSCARWGQLVVTPPNTFTSHTLPIAVPICNASISSVD